MNPQATYNVRPTYYYNVWSVELTEYTEPQGLNLEHDLSLATQLFSAQSQEVAWEMKSHSDILVAFDKGPDYSIFVDEASAIIKQLHRSRLIERQYDSPVTRRKHATRIGGSIARSRNRDRSSSRYPHQTRNRPGALVPGLGVEV